VRNLKSSFNRELEVSAYKDFGKEGLSLEKPADEECDQQLLNEFLASCLESCLTTSSKM